MRKQILLAVFVAALLAGAAIPAGAQPQSNEAVRKLYTDFFDAFTQAGPAGAIGVLAQSGSISQQTAQELESRMQPHVGRADSWTLVAELEIPNSLRYRSALFLTHHENVPMAWRLRFYQKTNGVWVISDVDLEVRFVEDFLRLPEIQFRAYRTIIERLPKEDGSRGRGSRWP